MKVLKGYIPYIVWATSLTSVLGSLYFSEIAGFAPCVLCWWQRIFMYPILAILTVGILTKDKNWPRYVLPLSIAGTGVAFYHELLQIGVIPEAVKICVTGVSCTTNYIDWFGFVSIPLLSLASFTLITVLSIILLKHCDKRS